MHSLVECVVALRLSLVACDQLRAIARIPFVYFTVVTVESHEDTLVKRDMDGKEYRGSTRRDNDTRPIPPQRVCVRSSILSDFLRIFCHRPGAFKPRGTASVDSRPSSASKRSFVSASSSLPFHVIVFALLSNERPYTNPG